jgi:hypothetical protein
MNHSAASQRLGGERIFSDGTDSLRDRELLGQSPPRSDRVGSQPAAEACHACPRGAPIDGRRSGAAGGSPSWRRRPTIWRSQQRFARNECGGSAAKTAGPHGFRGSGPQQILGFKTFLFSRLVPPLPCFCRLDPAELDRLPVSSERIRALAQAMVGASPKSQARRGGTNAGLSCIELAQKVAG